MAFTSDQLTALESAYAAGVTQVRVGDRTVVYGSLAELWSAILRLRKSLSSGNGYRVGRIRFRSPS